MATLAATLPLALALGWWIVSELRTQHVALEDGLRTTARAVAGAVEREIAVSRDALDDLAKAEPLQRGDLAAFEWDPLESTCRHASLSIL